MNPSPGIIGLYWLLGSFAAAAAWIAACEIGRRVGHKARARCYCGTCTR